MHIEVARSAWACAVSLCSVSGALAGGEFGPFVIDEDVIVDVISSRGPSYAGSYEPVSRNDPFFNTDYRGTVHGGGFDAYDDAGVILMDSAGRGASGVEVSRRVDALTAINVFRWIDTYTNLTDGPVTVDVGFWTNLGSDGNDAVAVQDAFRFVSFEDGTFGGTIPTDPVVAMMHGNNAWAEANIALERFDDEGAPFLHEDVIRSFRLTLGPGESRSLMFADFLAYTLQDEFGEAGVPGDIELALDRSAGLIADPSELFAGLERGVADGIVNWTIPSPGAAVVWAVGFVGVGRRRR